jgi:hypothetical protein
MEPMRTAVNGRFPAATPPFSRGNAAPTPPKQAALDACSGFAQARALPATWVPKPPAPPQIFRSEEKATEPLELLNSPQIGSHSFDLPGAPPPLPPTPSASHPHPPTRPPLAPLRGCKICGCYRSFSCRGRADGWLAGATGGAARRSAGPAHVGRIAAIRRRRALRSIGPLCCAVPACWARGRGRAGGCRSRLGAPAHQTNAQYQFLLYDTIISCHPSCEIKIIFYSVRQRSERSVEKLYHGPSCCLPAPSWCAR